jgi:hypothetical protein
MAPRSLLEHGPSLWFFYWMALGWIGLSRLTAPVLDSSSETRADEPLRPPAAIVPFPRKRLSPPHHELSPDAGAEVIALPRRA